MCVLCTGLIKCMCAHAGECMGNAAEQITQGHGRKVFLPFEKALAYARSLKLHNEQVRSGHIDLCRAPYVFNNIFL